MTTLAKPFWSVTAIPVLDVNSVKSNSISALPVDEFCAVYLLTVKKLKSLSAELNPSPIVLNFWIFSTNILSPTANGGGLLLNPKTGVTRLHVTTPVIFVVDGPTTVWIAKLLLLFVANTKCSSGFKPFGEVKISTPVIVLPVICGSIAPEPTILRVSGSTITNIGGLW